MLRFSLIVPNTRSGYYNISLELLPSMGLLSIASVLINAGFPVQYIDADIDNISIDDVILRLREFNCNIVGITMNAFQETAALDTAREIKNLFPGTIIITGGPHPSAKGIEILKENPFIDIVCIGEGEATIIEIADKLITGNPLSDVKGIYYRKGDDFYSNEVRPLIVDIDSLPYPAYEIAGNLSRYPGVPPVLKSHPYR